DATDPYRKQQKIGNIPLHVKAEVARRFNCWVLLLHQLSAKANELPPTKLPKATDSMDSKMFPVNCDFCFCNGTMTKENLCLFGPTKTRRAARQDPTIIRLDGVTGRLFDVHGQYRVTRRGIVNVADLE